MRFHVEDEHGEHTEYCQVAIDYVSVDEAGELHFEGIVLHNADVRLFPRIEFEVGNNIIIDGNLHTGEFY